MDPIDEVYNATRNYIPQRKKNEEGGSDKPILERSCHEFKRIEGWLGNKYQDKIMKPQERERERSTKGSFVIMILRFIMLMKLFLCCKLN